MSEREREAGVLLLLKFESKKERERRNVANVSLLWQSSSSFFLSSFFLLPRLRDSYAFATGCLPSWKLDMSWKNIQSYM